MTATARTPHAAAPLHVLLVDDDSISLELTTLLLAAEGALVEQAQRGQQAMDRLRTASPLPDVVLVDRQMPGISGVEVARFIHTLPPPRPRIIAMSATRLPESELGLFDHSLLKPLDRALLRDTLWNMPGVSTPTAPVAAFSALDPSRLQKLREIMPPEAIAELYTVYLADTRDRIGELERCAASGDQQGLRQCAHAIKGSSAMIGVPEVAAIAAGLESGDTSPQEYSKLFLKLRSACDDVERSMAGGPAPGEN